MAKGLNLHLSHKSLQICKNDKHKNVFTKKENKLTKNTELLLK